MRPALLPTKVLKVEGVVELSPSVSVGKGVSLVLTFQHHQYGPAPTLHSKVKSWSCLITIRLVTSVDFIFIVLFWC